MSHDLRAQLQRTLGDAYRVERELGGGGMSRVFLADEVKLDRKVVIKVLSPELAQGISVDRFEREIKTVAGLQQANIVPVLTAGDTDGLPFYSMPFVDGESLRTRLARGPLSATEVIGVLRDVSKALAYAHSRGVVHRDIKPDNVMLSGGTAVVLDFGIAKAISAARTDSGSATLTQMGTSIGTPAYMAPEQAAGDPHIDARADIYSLGAMAYELLTGQAVFAGRTPQRMLAAHMGEVPTTITDVRADIPAPLAELVMRCLEKEPDKRPQSANETVRMIETITSGSGMQSMPPILLGGARMFRKALMVYAAAFVVVSIVAKAAIVVIGLPEWVFAGSLIVMALGLPVVLWTGYVQHVTRRAMATTPAYTPGGTPSLTHGTIATLALKAAPNVSWYKTARGGMYAFGTFIVVIAVFMAMRAFGIGPAGSLLASGKLNKSDELLLTDFRTTNTDSTLGRVVSDAVRSGLNGSSAFTLTPASRIVSAVARMKLPPETKVDSGIARQIALRDGIKAIVDGEVTGVTGGYIVTLRLVSADSGIELASFRETGDGPRGLIDASDKLARKLRSKAGESLRAVNATPPLSHATTTSLDALRKFSEAVRRNVRADYTSIAFSREAVALDSTFATAWSGLAAELSNYGGTHSAIDSALTQAYRWRERLPANERDLVVGRFYAIGPGRDRGKAIAAYEAVFNRTGGQSANVVSIGEMVRSRREFARAESLNVVGHNRIPTSGTALGNMIEMQLNQGKIKEAAATVELLRPISPSYGINRHSYILWARGDFKTLRQSADSAERAIQIAPVGSANAVASLIGRALAIAEGRMRDNERWRAAWVANKYPLHPDRLIEDVAIEMQVRGPSPALAAKLDEAIAKTSIRDLPMVDRPYFEAAAALARSGNPEKARAMIARYKAEVTDTSLIRVQAPQLHNALGEIALAEKKPQDALVEFRKGDIGWDGAPADECAPCLSFNLARAFDAAGKADSATVMFERYLATPYWNKPLYDLDPVRLAATHERLGQIYEQLGMAEKAAEHDRAFIEIWKNADPELQPRVAEAKRRLEKLTPVEKPRK